MIYFEIVAVLIVMIAIKYWLFMSPFSQVFGAFPFHIKTIKKVVALTFDDGPNQPFTGDLLDFLGSQNIKATFFVVGSCAEKFPEIAKRIVAEGHTIGNHSYSHKFSNYLRPGFEAELTKTQAVVKKITNKTPALFRPPWLMHHPGIFKVAKNLGLTVVSGEFCNSREVAQIEASKIAATTIKKVKPGSIIIFHDGYDAKGGNRAQTIAAVKLVVPKLKAAGYSFVTVDKLLSIAPYQN